MRNVFAGTVISKYSEKDAFFLTGDLGFMALEKVRDAFSDRFINVGVAEQNMIGVAAGLAKEGSKVFAYSIAPFSYARPFEQIRNDLCFSALPVCVVGNGGGYAYGHMGPTHHALEDCAVMSAIGMKVLVPAFDKDIPAILEDLLSPTYLRLGYDVHPESVTVPEYKPWRKLLDGECGVLVALGPTAGTAWSTFIDLPVNQRPNIWVVCELDMSTIPDDFMCEVKDNRLFVTEEHVAMGGLGMNLTLALVREGVKPSDFVHRYALGYPSGRFGSQGFHRSECGLDENGMLAMVNESL